jgi:hypothetical protein
MAKQGWKRPGSLFGNKGHGRLIRNTSDAPGNLGAGRNHRTPVAREPKYAVRRYQLDHQLPRRDTPQQGSPFSRRKAG